MQYQRNRKSYAQKTISSHIIQVTIFAYILIFIFTNFLFYLFADYLSVTATKYIIAIRDFMILPFIIATIPKKMNLHKTPQLLCTIIFLFLIILIYFITLSTYNFASIFYARAFIQPWLFFILGLFLSNHMNKNSLNYWFKALFSILIIYSTLSLIFFIFHNYLINPELLNKYSELVNRGYDSYYNILGNAITYEFLKIVGIPITRLYGIMFDPPITGIFLSLFTIYIFLKRYNKIYLILPFIAGLLSFTKGFLFVSVISTFWIGLIVLLKNLNREKLIFYINKLIFFTIFVLSALLLYIIVTYPDMAITTSIRNHIQGLAKGIESIHYYPFGTGLGSHGNLAQPSDKVSYYDIARESYWGAFIGQLGLVGIILIFLIFYSIWKTLNLALSSNSILWMYTIFFFVVLLSAFFSESSLATRISSVIFFTFGLVYARINQIFN